MKKLVLMRGAPGSGKSTFIEIYSLEPYTICPDTLRLFYNNPTMTENGLLKIDQKNDNRVWELVYEMTENRMKRGDFTIIDATNSSYKSTKKFFDLAEKYEYEVCYYTMETSLDDCLTNNGDRSIYKMVGRNIIESMFKSIEENPLPKGRPISKQELLSNVDCEPERLDDKYDRVVVIGDVHSCNTALSELKPGSDPKTKYIFLGDLFDRGIEHIDTLDTIFKIHAQENVTIVRGNHERWIRKFIQNDQDIPETSKNTFNSMLDKYDIKDLKRMLSSIYSKLETFYKFSFNGKKFFCNHGGVPSIYRDRDMSDNLLINGFGSYNTNIDEIYENGIGRKYYGGDYTQVHGHRRTPGTEHSISLEGGVEFGEYLKYLEITKDGMEIKSIKNDVFGMTNKRGTPDFGPKTEDEEVNKMMRSPHVKVKECDPNLYSINFNREAFQKGIWNEITLRARGLFVDKKTGKIKARSYNKFFDIQDAIDSGYEFKFPIQAYRKENGFLGIISVDSSTGEFIFASKSTTNGDHVRMIKELFNKSFTIDMSNRLNNLLRENDCSMLVEVSHEDDQHIIDRGWLGSFDNLIYILDFVENKLDIGTGDIDPSFSESMFDKFQNNVLNGDKYPKRIEKKKFIQKIKSHKELEELILEVKNCFKNLTLPQYLEGVVFTDSSGKMFKCKTDYYNTWKRRRLIIDKIKSNPMLLYKIEVCDEDREFIDDVKRMPIDLVVSSKNIVEFRNKMNLCKELLPKSSSLFTQISRL